MHAHGICATFVCSCISLAPILCAQLGHTCHSYAEPSSLGFCHTRLPHKSTVAPASGEFGHAARRRPQCGRTLPWKSRVRVAHATVGRQRRWPALRERADWAKCDWQRVFGARRRWCFHIRCVRLQSSTVFSLAYLSGEALPAAEPISAIVRPCLQSLSFSFTVPLNASINALHASTLQALCIIMCTGNGADVICAKPNQHGGL